MAGANPQEPSACYSMYSYRSLGCFDMPAAVTVYVGILFQFLIFSAIFYMMEMNHGKLATR
jgi:ABC-type transport system involved in cytochrome bd biosynthesis fused ATPase/permease subunit